MKKYFFLIALLFFTYISKAQDVHFSQIFETPLLRNPALAGIFTGDLRLQTVYRSQWNSVTDAYKTGSLSGEYKIPVGQSNDFVTIGAQIFYDKAGTVNLTTTQVMPAINYSKSLSDEKNIYLNAGLSFGMAQRRIDESKITTNNQYSGGVVIPGAATGEHFNRNNYSYFDGAVGLSLNAQLGENANNNLYLGAAYHHFNKAKNLGFYSNANLEMKPKYLMSFGLRTNVNDYSFITLQGDYSVQDKYTEVVGGVLYSLRLDDPDNATKIFHIGSYIRWSDAIIPAAKIELKPLSIGVSYDINISPLKKVSMGRGGFELSLTYQKSISRGVDYSDPSTRCPRF